MKRWILVLLLWTIPALALLQEGTENRRDLSFLNVFDIEEAFLKDLEFQNLKADYRAYRQTMLLTVLSDASIYLPMIKEMLADAGLPTELVYMAMAESSFKNRAYSRARAVGIWQFMPATAKRFGLRVDLYVDERRDPIKSTEAAIRYMKYLHGMFGKWYLAMLAYNCGEGRLKKGIDRAGGQDDLSTLLTYRKGKRKQYLPRETRRYVRKIVALASLAESEEMMGGHDALHLLNRGSSYPLATVNVGPGTSLTEVAEAIGVSKKELRVHNASLRYDFVPPDVKNFDLFIPYEKVAIFKQDFVRKNPEKKFIVYKVRSGDSLQGIGRQFGISWQVVKDFNRVKGSMIRVGQQLVVPVDRPTVIQYTVQNGDTLIDIAKRYRISLNTLIHDNNKGNKGEIFVGEKLVIRR